MRLIGHVKNESSAKTLADYLLSIDIRSQIEPDAEGWAIWIYSEDQIEAGRQALSNFLLNPGDSRFQSARQQAAAIDERDRRAKAEFEKRFHTADQIWVSTATGPVTMTLMVLSVAVTALVLMNRNSPILEWLKLSQTSRSLPEIRNGEIWRLLTPIFIHFGVPHILFNMIVLRDMGSLIENRKGSLTLVLLVLVIGVGSNLGQNYFEGPAFGGMSGVNYGLLGYTWLRGACDPGSGLRLAPTTLVMMLVWFFLCLGGLIPEVANGAHAAGLLMGMLIGAAPLVTRIF